MVQRIKSRSENRRMQAIKDWLWWQSASLLVALYVVGKVIERLVQARRWHAFGTVDVAQLAVLALVVGTTTWYVRQRVQQRLAALEREQRQLELLMAENAAVMRAIGATIREVAQPLSGMLSYSEMLLLSVEQGGPVALQEVEGLREGALQLERLVHTLRQAIESTAACDAEYHFHLAEAVEQSVAVPRPRLVVRRAERPTGPA